jgi:hypothetical protein
VTAERPGAQSFPEHLERERPEPELPGALRLLFSTLGHLDERF